MGRLMVTNSDATNTGVEINKSRTKHEHIRRGSAEFDRREGIIGKGSRKV